MGVPYCEHDLLDEIPPAMGSGSRLALECWDTTVSEFAATGKVQGDHPAQSEA
jgi:hypothetical protein